MSLFVKVCGITSVDAGHACAEAGANAVGFVFADSPRRVSAERARAISLELPHDLLRVAVFRRPAEQELETVLGVFSPDLVQADAGTLGSVPEAEALPVFREGLEIGPAGGRFLYEGRTSGIGEKVDWGRAAERAPMGQMILAGGLRPDNVERAIAVVRPYGVDVSSGVETAPGVKDPALIHSFVAAARAAQERLVSR
jgi:phosphoribosylanthranilate isomerase